MKRMSRAVWTGVCLWWVFGTAGCAAAVQEGAAIAAQRSGEEVVVATWNIEHFMMLFDQEMMPERSRNTTEYYRDDEDLYEIARTMKLPQMDADVILIQEGPTQAMLELFVRERLGGRYAFVKSFEGNTEGQYLCMLIKPGFRVVQERVFKEDIDAVSGKLLFSRGPAFVLLETPKGRRIWIGTTHAKSKADNSKSVTEWRIREMVRTRQICGQLLSEGQTDFLLMGGDFNDDFGLDSYEKSVGQDGAAVMVSGEGKEKLICLDEAIWKKNPQAASYHCEIKPPRYRSFLDHFFASPALAERMKGIALVDDPIAAVASDHYPLVVRLVWPEEDSNTAETKGGQL
jgi:endonuclease/exonuclease/phosphatase family metal-dependent hydrolase